MDQLMVQSKFLSGMKRSRFVEHNSDLHLRAIDKERRDSGPGWTASDLGDLAVQQIATKMRRPTRLSTLGNALGV
jgi:hypothetical protein